jgi:hypothetical protein
MEKRNPNKKIKRLAIEFSKHYEAYQFDDFCTLHDLSPTQRYLLENSILASIERHPVTITY